MSDLYQALAQLAPMLDELPLGIQFIDSDMRYRYLNRRAAEHGKRPASELLGRTMQECYPGIEATEMYAHVETTFRTGDAFSMENAFEFSDGSQGCFELRMVRVFDGVVITSVDITQRKLLEVHHHHAQRMDAARRLAGGVAHDFNNLLTIIGSYTGIVLKDAGLPARHRADLSQVARATSRAVELTRKLLALSDHSPGPVAPLDTAERLRSLQRTLLVSLGRGITLEMTVPDELGTVSIDSEDLEQVIVSLVLNANEALGGTGTIIVDGTGH